MASLLFVPFVDIDLNHTCTLRMQEKWFPGFEARRVALREGMINVNAE